MSSYIAKSTRAWAEFLKKENITDNFNFWSPSPIPLLRGLPGNRLFFYPKTSWDNKRRVVGWGLVREHRKLSLIDAWERYGVGNGAHNLEDIIQRFGLFKSYTKLATEQTVIGNTILDDVVWLDNPIEIEQLGIYVAPQAVRGRSITKSEEQLITQNRY